MTRARSKSHFLVEWYRPDAASGGFDDKVSRLAECAASASAGGAPVHLLVTLAVPGDEVAFGVFDAHSAGAVAEVCGRAGIPPQRLTPVVNARFL
jgi:hypothetical protein